jgi:hypothetical protein
MLQPDPTLLSKHAAEDLAVKFRVDYQELIVDESRFHQDIVQNDIVPQVLTTDPELCKHQYHSFAEKSGETLIFFPRFKKAQYAAVRLDCFAQIREFRSQFV